MNSHWKTGFLTFGLLFVVDIVFAQVNVTNQISRTISSNIAKNLTDRMLKPQLKIRNESGEVKDFSVSADFRLFTLLHDDNTVRVWDAKQGIQRPTIASKGQKVTKVVISICILCY